MYNSYCLLYSSHFAVKLACKNNMNIMSYYLWLRRPWGRGSLGSAA